MPRRVEDLTARVETVESEVEQLLDEYVEIRRRLEYVQEEVGTGDGRRASEVELPSFESNETTGTGSSEQASQDEVDEAVQSAAGDGKAGETTAGETTAGETTAGDGTPEGKTEGGSGLDDIIIA